MNLGYSLPLSELDLDAAAIRDLAQAVEGLGFTHITMGDHVLGADTTNRPGYEKEFPVTNRSVLREPMALMGFLAGCTDHIGFSTSILILPQRQTAVVAKQAAEVDRLCGGRLRLGVGLGRYEVEYEALGQDIHNRGRRIEEQVAVLRELWTKEVVTFRGNWHRIEEAGINPLPMQRPIPIWFGGGGRSEIALRRIARLADGWFPPGSSREELVPLLARLREHARACGRNPDAIQIEGRMSAGRGNPDTWRRAYQDWSAIDAAYLSVGTGGAGFTTVDEHIRRLREAKEALA